MKKSLLILGLFLGMIVLITPAQAALVDPILVYGADGGGGSTPVPEPATMILLGTGLIGLAFFIRRREIFKK